MRTALERRVCRIDFRGSLHLQEHDNYDTTVYQSTREARRKCFWMRIPVNTHLAMRKADRPQRIVQTDRRIVKLSCFLALESRDEPGIRPRLERDSESFRCINVISGGILCVDLGRYCVCLSQWKRRTGFNTRGFTERSITSIEGGRMKGCPV
jgi:hypothetical protein